MYVIKNENDSLLAWNFDNNNYYWTKSVINPNIHYEIYLFDSMDEAIDILEVYNRFLSYGLLSSINETNNTNISINEASDSDIKLKEDLLNLLISR